VTALAVATHGRAVVQRDPEPRHLTVLPPGARHYAADLLRVSDAMGLVRQPWVERLAPGLTAIGEDGEWLYSDLVVTVPRQTGKSTLLGPLSVHRCLAIPGAQVWVTAQTRGFASDLIMREWAGRVVGRPAFPGSRLRRSVGTEHLMMPGGGTVRPFPPNVDGLHGRYAHLVAVDEVWAHGEGTHLEQAVRPTLTTTGGQAIWVSTAGDATSGLLRRLVERGRAGQEGIFLADWGLDPAAARYVEALLHEGTARALGEAVDLTLEQHPGVLARRGPLLAAAGSMVPGEWLRAYANVWTAASHGLIPAQRWHGRRITGDTPVPSQPLVLGVAADPPGGGGAVVAAWRHNGRTLVDVVDHRPGVEWLPAAAADLYRRLRPRELAVDRGDPAYASVETAVLAHGVPAGRVHNLTAGEYAAACARWLDMLATGEVAHSGHEELTRSALAGQGRQLGDRWVWDRRSGDPCALVAATVAARRLEARREAQKPEIA
jgi:hypothetical protein